MINKNLRIEISQIDGSILKSHNTGGLKIDVDRNRKKVIISAEGIDKSIYRDPTVFQEQNKKILLATSFFLFLVYLLILWLIPNDYQSEKFLFSIASLTISGFIFSYLYKNISLMISILIIFILIALFSCEFIPYEALLKIFDEKFI